MYSVYQNRDEGPITLGVISLVSFQTIKMHSAHGQWVDGILLPCDPMNDHLLYLGHCDLYFMVQ